MAIPLARGLKQQGYRVEWLVHPGSQHVLDDQSFADRVHVLPDDFMSSVKLAGLLWQAFDQAFVVNGTDRLMLYGRLAASHVYATLTEDRFSDMWKRSLATRWSPFGEAIHARTYVRRLAELAGEPVADHAGLDWTDEDAKRARNIAGVSDQAYLLLHPFSRVRYKYWPDQHWQKLIELACQKGLYVVLSGSEYDAEKAEVLLQYLPEDIRQQVHIVCGHLNWRELAALSAQAQCFVGVDTANTHLAATTGVPVVALFGPTDPRLWGPFSASIQTEAPWQASSSGLWQINGNVTLIQGGQACVPCQQEGCDRHTQSHSECLDSIHPDRVWQRCLEVLDGKPDQ